MPAPADHDLDLLLLITGHGLFDEKARAGLDLALVSATFEQKTAVVFWQQGITQLLAAQDPQKREGKNLLARIQAFPLYDLNEVYVATEQLAQYSLNAEQLGYPAQLLPEKQVAALIERARHTLVF